MRYVLITGYPGAGKDTVADIFQHSPTSRYVPLVLGLADPAYREIYRMSSRIRKELAQLTEPGQPLNWRAWKDQDIANRVILQRFLDGGKDLLGQNCWCEHLQSRINELEEFEFGNFSQDHANFIPIIRDWRRIHEYEFFKEVDEFNEPITIRVTRPGTGKVSNHISESEYDLLPVKYTIENSADIPALTLQVRDIIKKEDI